MTEQPDEEFRQFMHGRWPAMVRLAYGLTGDLGHAEDVAQAAFAKAYMSWPRVIRAGNPDATSAGSLLMRTGPGSAGAGSVSFPPARPRRRASLTRCGMSMIALRWSPPCWRWHPGSGPWSCCVTGWI